MMFADTLFEALDEVTRAVQGACSLLFLYDDLADGFSSVATIGGYVDDEVDVVVAASDNVLTYVLESRIISCEPLDAEIVESSPVLTRLIGLRPALLVPLFAATEVGVVVIRGDELDLRALTHDQEWLVKVASTAAEAILRARPEVEHWCRFRQILEVDPGGIAVVEGTSGVVSYANTAFRGMLGVDGTPLLGRSAQQALAGPLGPGLLDGLQRARASSTAYHEPRLEIRDQYGLRYYELNLVPEHEHTKEADVTFIILWDRTDMVSTRIALEHSVRELADSQSLLSAVLDSTNNGIILVGTDARILYANRRLAELFELEVQDLVGRSQETLVAQVKDQMKDPDAFAYHQAYLYDHFEEKLSDQVEMIRPTHRILDRYSGPVYKQNATLLGRIEVYTDVTEVQQLQRNKDEFLSVVSHELKTPVTSIKGYAQLLRRRAIREQLQASTVTSFGVIERQANRMQELIETLLDLSRWDLGKLTFEPREIDFTALVRHAAELVGMTSEARRIEFDLPDSPVWIRGDERRMEQVVTNLLLNAVQYSPGGEVVTVSLREGDNVRLAVQDRGIGIPPQAQPRIFERFYRGPGMTNLTGLGIGLYISKNIVEQHGGRIEVESEVGAGSTFTVSLPRLLRPNNPEEM